MARIILVTPNELRLIITVFAVRRIEFYKRFMPEPFIRLLITELPDSITTIDQAKAYLTDLYNNKEDYHTDDCAIDCLNVDIQTGTKMNNLRDSIYDLQNANFDACGFLLNLDPDYKMEEDEDE